MLLTCSMIVKNEADRLADCLKSVRPHVDELIIVDTGSTDDTFAIASGFADKLERSQKFNADTKTEDFHFAEARNEALSLCSGDWVLSVDADEDVICDGRHREALEGERGRASLLAMRSTLDKSTAWVPRLFRRDGVSWVGRYHDVPSPLVDVSRFPAPSLSLLNYGIPSKDKLHRNVVLLTRQLHEDGRVGYTSLRLADAYLAAGKSHAAEALGYYMSYLEHGHIGEMWRYVATQIAKCFYFLGLQGAALEWLFRVQKQFPNCEMSILMMGGCYYRLGQYGMAKAFWNQLLSIPPDQIVYLHPVIDDPVDRQAVAEWIDVIERKYGC